MCKCVSNVYSIEECVLQPQSLFPTVYFIKCLMINEFDWWTRLYICLYLRPVFLRIRNKCNYGKWNGIHPLTVQVIADINAQRREQYIALWPLYCVLLWSACLRNSTNKWINFQSFWSWFIHIFVHPLTLHIEPISMRALLSIEIPLIKLTIINTKPNVYF